MTSESARAYTMRRRDRDWIVEYQAMAGPCEVHICCEEKSEADHLASLALFETRRIEHKYSRYRDDSIVTAINTAQGRTVDIDEETMRLLEYADQCHRLSDGLFDITSGVLRRAWRFKGEVADPDRDLIDSLLEKVGWDRVTLGDGAVTIPAESEIDLGGIGKEYAVDRVAQLLTGEIEAPLMVNFGGDIRVVGVDSVDRSWSIGIEDPQVSDKPVGQIELHHGAVATSGDARRFSIYQGKRLGHILNPKTGWPAVNMPRSVTVIGSTCLEAGFLATLSMLYGADAEQFLDAQQVEYHCIR